MIVHYFTIRILLLLCVAAALRQERSPRRGARRVGAINTLQSVKNRLQERPSVQIQHDCVSSMIITLYGIILNL